MVFYKTKKWKHLRENILRRDGYMCQVCKQRGVIKDAEHVHHINQLEDRPDLACDPSNLISLCKIHHNAMHNRDIGTLTRLGIALQKARRTKMKVNIVYGAPCSGRLNYIKMNAERNDLIFDFDLIAEALTINNYKDINPNLIKYILSFKELILDKLQTETEFENVWISTFKLDFLNSYYFYNLEIIRMDTTLEQCLENLENLKLKNSEMIKQQILKFYEK